MKSHMNISKLRPRLVRGRVRGLVAILASKGRAQDRIGRNAKDRKEDGPLQPDSFLLVFPQPGPQVEKRDPQPVDRMEEGREEDKDLEEPVLIDIVQESPDLALKKGCYDVHGDKDRHAQSADTMQDKRQLPAPSPVPQACPQRYVPIQAHRKPP